MKMNDNQYYYSEISKDGSTSHVQIVAEKKYSDRPRIVIEVNKVDEVDK